MSSRSVVVCTRCVRNSRIWSYTLGCCERVGIWIAGNSGKVGIWIAGNSVLVGLVCCGGDDIVCVVSVIAKEDIVRGQSVQRGTKTLCVKCLE
jgi:hypothetical protein